MKKVLFICSNNPFEITDGINLVTNNLIQEFSKDYLVDIALPIKSNINNNLKINRLFFYEKKRSLSGIIRDFFNLSPLYFNMYYNKRLKKNIKNNCKDYKIIIYDFYPLGQLNVGYDNEVLIMPDSMKLLYLSYFKNEKNFLKKIYSFINYIFTNKTNRKFSKMKKLYVSEYDINFDNLPNSFYFKRPPEISKNDVIKYHNIKANKNEILFRGIMNFEPNITALKSFYYEIFIYLKEKIPNIKLIVIGGGVSENLKQELKEVEFKGYVNNMYEEMAKSLFHVIPMKSGSGIKNKLLDAMALKKISFSTEIGIRGIFKNNKEAFDNGVIVYKDKNDFIEKFYNVYINGYDNKKLENGFNFVFKETWEKKKKEIINLIYK
jgi:glycosyltransferase involved in cell wall biosynthesis